MLTSLSILSCTSGWARMTVPRPCCSSHRSRLRPSRARRCGTRSTSTWTLSGRSSTRACTWTTVRASAPGRCSASRCASTCRGASRCSRRSASFGGASSRSSCGSCGETRTQSTSLTRASTSGTGMARGSSSTSVACRTARRWTWALCMAFSGGTLAPSMSTCTRTTPARASISSRSASARSRKTRRTGEFCCPRGTRRTLGRWRCRRATCSASSTSPTGNCRA
mmetsp:Transcript_59988/g.173731  ORF Transcript_59988/g.173731 Transcript_59988/m.173731 type:complete len:224 (-) Transcript_59988:479-1150(-)